jgi:hypothetical protein
MAPSIVPAQQPIRLAVHVGPHKTGSTSVQRALAAAPDCTHSHEADCGVKHAVADGLLDTRRWESCCHMATNLGDTPEDDE